MKTFDLPAGSRLKVVKATNRKEHHGPDKIQAVSLKLEWRPMDNAALNMVVAGLQDALLWIPPEAAAQDSLDGVEPVKKHRRCPDLGMPLKCPAAEFTGYTLRIEHGIDETTALELYSCKLSKFEAEVQEGGAAVIRFSVGSNREITPELLGALCNLEETEIIVIEMTPPADDSDVIDGSVEAFEADHPDATDLFAEAHGDAQDEIDALESDER
jgi:hypothetical protein